MGTGIDHSTEAVRALARTGRCWSPSFSPDGSEIALVSDLSGIRQVWKVPTDGGWPELVTAVDDDVQMVLWSPEGTWLAFSVAPQGGMNTQVYITRADGTELRRVTDGGAETNWLGPWTRDGGALCVASNRQAGETIDAYLVDIPSGSFRLVAANPGVGAIVDVSRDGTLAVLNRVAHRSDNNLYLIDMIRNTESLLTPHEGPGTFSGARISADGQSIYLSSNKDREHSALTRIRLDSVGQPGPMQVVAARDDAELQIFAVSPDGQVAALVWNVAGESELALLDLLTLVPPACHPLAAEIVHEVVFAADGSRLALSLSGAASPMDVWVLDMGTRERDVAPTGLRQVTRSPRPGVRLETLIRPELVRFPAHDGLELSGWLYRPSEGADRGSLVISFHGGPEAQERPDFEPTYQALLRAGIAVFAPNVRGSSGFGKTFANLDNGTLRVDAIEDIRSCVDFLVDRKVASIGTIGVMGESYGGYMALSALTEFPECFAAGVDLFGIANLETFFLHTAPWMAAISTIEYGDPATEMDLLRSLSPIHKIERVAAPTLILHGANDTNVPVIEAEQVVASLERLGIPVEYILFPDEGHGFKKLPNRVTATLAIVRWFTTYLRV